MALLSIIPTSSSPARSATAKPRSCRSPPPGIPASSAIARDGAVLPILHLNGYVPVNFAHHGHPCPIHRLTLNVTVS